MSFYTEAHYSLEGQPEVSAVVPANLIEDGVRAYSIMGEILKERLATLHPGHKIGAALVFACHEGDPDPSLFLTEEEQSRHFPVIPQATVRMLGTH